MANLNVRTDDENKASPLALEQMLLEPLRMMPQLAAWDPFGDLAAFTSQLSGAFAPAFEIKETKDGYTLRADIPGVKDADVDVTTTGNRLTVSGKRDVEQEEETDTFYACERSYGDFLRSFTLPEGVDMDSVRADISRGVLTISIKKTATAQPKKISIRSLFHRS